MASYRVLLVDDQTEVRRMIRAGIETLQQDIKIVDVPSAEEALLELSRHPVELLVVDIRLPGMSGLELIEKLRKRRPETKVMIITGLSDTKIWGDISGVGAVATFSKPLPMSDFLEAVQRALGITPIQPPYAMDTKGESTQLQNVEERLNILLQALRAISVLLLDRQGKVVAQAGKLSMVSMNPVLPAITEACTASAKVSILLGMDVPQTFLFIEGNQYNLTVAHVGDAHYLVVLMDSSFGKKSTGIIGNFVRQSTQELTRLLSTPTDAEIRPEGQMPAPPETKPEEQAVETGQNIDVEAIFKDAPHQKPDTADLDAFWEEAIDQSNPNAIDNADALTYDEARRLGLAPRDDSP